MKTAAADKAMFRGFYDRVMKSVEDGGYDEMMSSTGLLRGDRTGPAKDDRPPRAAYARGEMSRTLVDHVVQKAAT